MSLAMINCGTCPLYPACTVESKAVEIDRGISRIRVLTPLPKLECPLEHAMRAIREMEELHPARTRISINHFSKSSPSGSKNSE